MPAKKQKSPAVEPLAYDLDQTGLRLGGLSRSKLYIEMAAGDLEYFRIGDKRFTTTEQQLRYLERKQQQQSAA